MDKARDVRRVKASRFSSAKPSGCEKLKGEKVRKLSFLGRISSRNPDFEMGSVQSDGEDEFRPSTSSTSKRFRLPKKFFDDCNTVDHASVPRKLRSAIKKRNLESVSPLFPESRMLRSTANGVELRRKDRMKKSKLKQLEESEGTPGHPTVGSISKDEEEVAETLYALAGMFPDTDKTERNDSDSNPSKAKSLALREEKNSTPPFEVPEVENDSKTTFPIADAEAGPQPSNLRGSAVETVEIQFTKQETEFDLDKNKQFSMESHSYIPKANQRKISLFGSTLASESHSSNAAAPNHYELSWGTRFNQSLNDGDLASGRNKEIVVGSVEAFGNQHEPKPENKNRGSALWPGLSPSGLHSADMQGLSVKCSAAKLPAWLRDSTNTARPSSSGNVGFAEKESRAPVDAKNSRKKCSAHVYICRLIKVLQITERIDGSPLQRTEVVTDEGLKQGALSESANKLHGVAKNGLNEVVDGKSPDEVINAILLHKRLLEDQQHGSTTRGPNASQKQSFNFLSLPAGGCGVEAKSVIGRAGNGLKESAQFDVPYLYSLAQNHSNMSASLPQSHHASPFLNRSSAAAAQKVQIHMPPLGNSVSGASPSSVPIFPKHQQQQQWFLATQFTGHYKPGEFAASHIPNLQNGRQDSPSIMQYDRSIIDSSSRHSLDVLGPGPMYIQVSPQHQQQLISNSNTSLYPQRKGQQHQLPLGPGWNGGIYRPDSASSLQLLCNEHL